MKQLSLPDRCTNSALQERVFLLQSNFYFHNLEVHDTGGHLDFHAVAHAMSDQCLGDGRGRRDFHLLEISLAFGHDGIGHLRTVGYVLYCHFIEKLHLLGVQLAVVEYACARHEPP